MSEFATASRSLIIATSLTVLLSSCSTVTVEVEEPAVTQTFTNNRPETITHKYDQVRTLLGKIAIKGRAPMTGFDRDKFHFPSGKMNGCPTYDGILKRDLHDIKYGKTTCYIEQGTLDDPYTGQELIYIRGLGRKSKVNVDHVVSLGDAWQKGAQQFDDNKRRQFGNDPLNLRTVSATANRQKQDGDAATWQPSNRTALCGYVATQVEVKEKYGLWMTRAEHDRIAEILNAC